MIKEWEKDYKEEMGESPGIADIGDFYNFWYNRIYSQMNYCDRESMKKYLIWDSSFDEIYGTWFDYWDDKE